MAGLVFAGCAPESGEHALAMAHLEDMPDEVQQAMVPVRQAYQIAGGNPEVFHQIPCYCGCVTQGHTSNYDCYVASATGEIQYDLHALACEVCVDITHDVKRLLKEGQALPEIRAYVDATYAQYGPSTGP